MSDFPYAERFPVNRRLPAHGRPRQDVLGELHAMAREEDAFWETGKCSGTMYSGDHDHYRFLEEAFGLFAHVNVLQRDMCPSATKFEGEIIAMALDLMHADVVEDTTPAGLVTSGGTDSILHAVLAFREYAAQERGIDGSTGRPNIVKPETAHPAFDKAARLLGVELRMVPVTDDTTVDPEAMAKEIDDLTIGIIGSAGNYGYGTIDPIADLGRLALDRGVALHVDGCLGGFILPFGEELGYDVPPFDFRVPGVTSDLRGHPQVRLLVQGHVHAVVPGQGASATRSTSSWPAGAAASTCRRASRARGPAGCWRRPGRRWCSYGREGYLEHARAIFATAERMKAAVRAHPELRIIGRPTFCFSFTSDAFDIYHVADFMRERGWRFNGQQYPNAIHMAVTGPQTQPGVVEQFETDLAEAVPYAVAREAAGEAAVSGAIYGGVAGGLTSEVEEFIAAVMSDMLDTQQSLPPTVP